MEIVDCVDIFFLVKKGFAMYNYVYILIIGLILFIGYLIVVILFHVCLCITEGSGIKVQVWVCVMLKWFIYIALILYFQEYGIFLCSCI